MKLYLTIIIALKGSCYYCKYFKLNKFFPERKIIFVCQKTSTTFWELENLEIGVCLSFTSNKITNLNK